MEESENIENELMTQKLELQLHEQYAINNNANLSSIVTLICTILVIFGSYGYVFVHLTYKYNGLGHLYYPEEDAFSFVVLAFMACAIFFIVPVINYICLYIGCHQRFDQFIVYAIRYNYYGHKDHNELNTDIFPEHYHPFGKLDEKDECFCLCIKNCLLPGKICQGLFGELIPILWCVELIVVISSIIMFSNCLSNVTLSNVLLLKYVALLTVSFFLPLLVYSCCGVRNLKDKYLDYCKQYNNIKPK